MNKLIPLPCPWCGEDPHVDPTNWRGEGDAWAGVSCDNDDCPVKPSFRNWANVAGSGAKASERQKHAAVTIWNTRTAQRR